ncbi:hypothetical protein K501DRAFT_275329 [Backusella circina FSU 941]|nr:hypothetical protein K501DRAFT_275329 [Backusella circina FSU 941]
MITSGDRLVLAIRVLLVGKSPSRVFVIGSQRFLTQRLNSLNHEKATLEQRKQYTDTEMDRLRASFTTLEQLLKSKEDTIVLLNRENQTLSTAIQGNQQGTNEMVETLKSLLQAKSNELELNKSNMKLVLDKEIKRNKKLQKEIEMLKQQQKQHSQSSMAISPNSAAVSGDNILYTNTNGNDDANNDINYDTECGTEDSTDDSSEDGSDDNDDDINYDTPNESEDAHNDLNYDANNQTVTK